MGLKLAGRKHRIAEPAGHCGHERRQQTQAAQQRTDRGRRGRLPGVFGARGRDPACDQAAQRKCGRSKGKERAEHWQWRREKAHAHADEGEHRERN